jgi:RNA polymerase sigma-70 factor (ECF subfamily)
LRIWHAEAERHPPASHALSERQVILEEALRRLPPYQREALVLSRFHDLSCAEVGKILGCSEGAARVRIHRALFALRECVLFLERTREVV